MDRIVIQGGRTLNGRVPISGAKNAALALMPCSLLTHESLTLRNLPRLADIDTMVHLLNRHGVSMTLEGGRQGCFNRIMSLKATQIGSTTAPYDIVRRMRASILVLGPLLARCGEAKVSLPGGCAIGNRPIDLHLMAMERLGAEISLSDGYVHAKAPKGLKGGHVVFPTVSVGATENLLMAATLARGETVIENAAREPEIVDLAECLTKMGARIDGIGSSKLVIQGRDELHGATHVVLPDRIEAGSYSCAVAIAGGVLELTGPGDLMQESLIKVFEHCGVTITPTENGLSVSRSGDLLGCSIVTAPFPGFPTDMQAQFMAMLCLAKSDSTIIETIFENRYMHVPELSRMGADISVQGSQAIIHGVERLYGAQVMATDLRASMGLVIAGLAAEGETVINRVYHLDRGYERLEEKLQAVGAQVERVGSD